MLYPDIAPSGISDCRLIYEKHAYDITNLGNRYDNQLTMLTDEQHSVFEEIMEAVDGNDDGGFFPLRVWWNGENFFMHDVVRANYIKRSNRVKWCVQLNCIILSLDGGRTTHSRFHIPLNLIEDSVCHIKPDSDVAKLLHETKLVIWDEAPMVHKYAFEVLDRIMNDIFNMDTSLNFEIWFGGKVIVFGGDLRQILPVVPSGGRQEIVNASLSSSYLWSKCEGNVDGTNDGETTIDIPPDLLITDRSNPIFSLIDFLFPSILENINNHNYFSERAILAPKNNVVHEIKDRLLSMFSGEEREYLSSDSLGPTEDASSTQQRIYSQDVLNCLKILGLPNHRLAHKVGVPIMLLQNIDQRNSLCNGTSLKVKEIVQPCNRNGNNIWRKYWQSHIYT